jgi:effector-binding domain-containing protein
MEAVMEAPLIKDVPAQMVASVKHDGSYDEIGKVFGALFEWIQHSAASVAGPGMTIFMHRPGECDPTAGAYEVCLPISGSAEDSDAVTVKELPAAKVAAAQVTGPYKDMPAHYGEFLAWADSEGWEITGNPREIYLVHPDAEGHGDPDKFVTELQFPIEA